LELPGLTLLPMGDGESGERQRAKFDLTLDVREVGGRLQLNWNYNSDLFESATIARMASHFNRLVAEGLNRPTESVHALGLLSAEEIAQLNSWNETSVDYPQDLCIHQLFEMQAQR